MLSYLGQRFLTLIIVMIVVTMIMFGLMHAVPGGPFSQTQQPLPAFAMANIEAKYGLNQPIWLQYLKWLWAALHGDFGIPFEEPTETVTELISKAWPVTLAVGAWTIVISYIGGIALGLISAIKQNTWIDWFLTSFATTGIALPNYVVGFLLIAIFAVSLGWLPTGGWGQPQDLILPVVAFALNPMALCARYTRSQRPRGHARRLRAHGQGQGPPRVADQPQLRAAHRVDPADHDPRPEHPQPRSPARSSSRPPSPCPAWAATSPPPSCGATTR